MLPGLALVLAWALDAAFGEPRNAWHPVAWLGRVLGPIGRWLKAQSPGSAFAGGALVWLVMAAVLGAVAWQVEAAMQTLPWWLGVPLLALALKPMFAWRMLRDEVAAVEGALDEGLPQARAQLSRLVSRDVSAFGPADVRETAIETLAENLNDSLVAPLFWFAVAGLPGAVVYRMANTMDAMWGYRGAWEWAGKFAARADDVLSWIPARLTALLLAPGWRAGLWHEAQRTPSPNGGWPMGAMALHLGVRLSKPGVYALNAGAAPPAAGDLSRALRVAGRAAWAAVGLALLAVAWRTA